jgi:hypothetical protein
MGMRKKKIAKTIFAEPIENQLIILLKSVGRVNVCQSSCALCEKTVASNFDEFFNAMKKFAISLIGLLAVGALVGCDGKGVNSVQTNVNSSAESRNSGIDGYKSYKFGMSPLQVMRETECQDKGLAYDQIIKWINEIISGASSAESPRHIENNWSGISQNGIPIPNPKTPQEVLNAMKSDEFVLAAVTGKLESYRAINGIDVDDIRYLFLPKFVSDGKVSDEVRSLVNTTTDKLKQKCKTQFSGEERRLTLGFNSENKLQSVEFRVGQYEPTIERKLINDLSEKYALYYEPTNEQVAKYNTNPNRFPLFTLFASGQVFIYDTEYMDLGYVSQDVAKNIIVRAHQGSVRKSDL